MPAPLQIQLLEGFCTLRFGSDPASAKLLFGDPGEEDVLKDEVFERETLVFHYPDSEFSLFFEKNPEPQLHNVECENPEVLLNGQKPFSLGEKELSAFLKASGYSLSEREQLPWGELCLSFDSAGLTCYFQNNKLVALSFSSKVL